MANGVQSVWRVTVRPRGAEHDAHGRSVLHDVHEYGRTGVERVDSARLFFLRGRFDASAAARVGAELLADPITETYDCSEGQAPEAAGDGPTIEVHLKPGVMDPVAASTIMAIRDMGLAISDVRTARSYRLLGADSVEALAFIAKRVLANDCIEDVYLSGLGRRDEPADVFRRAPLQPFALRTVAIRDRDDPALKSLSRDGHLFLSLAEMRVIQAYYRKAGRDPTDLELETLAQTWSEHCVHKTLKSPVVYRGAPMPNAEGRGGGADAAVELRYDNLLADTIARATHELIADGRASWCLSVFEDNAGVIVFDDDYGVAFKVETHNHPSAIEPYGGAATGVGGVIRDVMGCGLGARPVANTDVFCVGLPDFPLEQLPAGVLHPRRILKGVVAGVRDYGNRMGIPTVNGAVVFDPRYMGNPLVFCGCVGLIPRYQIAKAARPGDLVVVVGGRTGRDGIHGATFSSAELTDSHADEFSHAVQIGNAISEKKVLDVQMQARDHERGCLYTATTDCGAGGLSSAVGEMGAKTGVVVDLEKVPLKYAGLRYDEIWISEAQERMVFAVPPENWPELKRIFDAEDVEATVIGEFTGDKQLVVRYEGTEVGRLDMGFLHKGVPRAEKAAEWAAPREPTMRAAAPGAALDYVGELTRRLSSLNACSKEWIIRQYDHEVQGSSVVKPLVGEGEGPSDAAVIRPRLDSRRGIAIGCGLCPHLGDVDPYWMAAAAIDEAIRNVIAVGGDPERTAILDNFCWGNCEDASVMGALVRACQACYDAAKTYGVPFISGKDSLNNEFAMEAADAARLTPYFHEHGVSLFNDRLRIPSTLLISAISVIDDVSTCVTSAARPCRGDAADDETAFWLVGLPAAANGPTFSMTDAAAMHRAVSRLIRDPSILAAHDLTEDGFGPALAEMAIGGCCDVDVYVGCCAPFDDPFAPWPSGYVLQVSDSRPVEALAADGRFIVGRIGAGTGRAAERLTFWRESRASSDAPEFTDEVGRVTIAALREAWRAALAW